MKDKIIRNFWDKLFPDEYNIQKIEYPLVTRLKIKQKKVIIVSTPKGV